MYAAASEADRQSDCARCSQTADVGCTARERVLVETPRQDSAWSIIATFVLEGVCRSNSLETGSRLFPSSRGAAPFRSLSVCVGATTSQLRPTVERIGTLPCFGFDKLADNGQSFGFGKARDRCALGFNAEARALLLLCGDT